jgi:Lrp/AsnC family transcriptional regulator
VARKSVAQPKGGRRHTLDEIDRRILGMLQSDATRPLAEMAEAAGLSTTPCWRRIQQMEERGLIKRRIAVLDREQLNANVTVFIAIRTSQHTAAWIELFRRATHDIPEIVDVYRMSGEIDYLIRAFVPDIASYDALYKKLIARIDVNDVTSMFAMEEIKSTTAVPLGFV